MEQEALTAANLTRTTPLWPDREGYSAAEFVTVTRHASLLLSQRRAVGALLHEHDQVCGFGLTVFVDEAFAHRFLAHPFPQMGKYLLLAAFDASTPVLTVDGIARRNAAGGLQLVVVATNIAAAVPDRATALGYLIHAFVDTHAGYRPERVFNEVIGGRNVCDIQSANIYAPLLSYEQLENGARLPGTIGTLTRAEAANRSTLLPLFNYSPPVLLFSAGQQELLRAALDGETDESLARRLGVSVSTVKARWTRIYERAARQLPSRFADVRSRPDDERRGAQLRHHVIRYVRANPSELTPYLAPSASVGPEQVLRDAGGGEHVIA